MSKNRAYFEAQESKAEGRYLSATGEEWSQADGEWSDADGDWSEADAWTSAAGNQPMQRPAQHAGQQSPPIIIKIQNTSSSDINNVDLYDAYQNYQAGVSGNFNQPSGIAITSQIANVTYLQMLANSWGKPMKIGRTVLVSSTPNQTEQPFIIRHSTDYGQLIEHNVTPFVDPYQNQNDRIIENYNYTLDGFTRIRISTLLANATIYVRLYPASRFSPTNLAAGGSKGGLTWNKPVLVRPAVRGV